MRTSLLATAGVLLALCACHDNDESPALKKSTSATPPPATKPAPMTTKPAPTPAPTPTAKPTTPSTTEPMKSTPIAPTSTPAPGSTAANAPQSTTPQSTAPPYGTTEPLASGTKSTTPAGTPSSEPIVKPVGVTAAAGLRSAVARLSPTSGNQAAGTVTFTAASSGMGVTVQVSMSGLTPGEHGMHIHEKGDCSAPDATSAGEHFSATPSQHGGPHDTMRHTGDLGNIVADAQGKVETSFQDDRISLSGPDSILNKAVIVHAGKDDFTTQPSGASGARVACGVIEGQQQPEVQPETPTPSEPPSGTPR